MSVDGIASQPLLGRALARLAQRGAVACLDRRGTGLSDPVLGGDPSKPPPMDQWVDDVLAVVHAVATTPVLVACSDTCLTAVAAATGHPDRLRALVLVHGYARYTRRDGYDFGVDRDTAAAVSSDVLDVDRAMGFDPLAHIAPSTARDPQFRRWFEDTGRRAASPSVAAALHAAILAWDVRPLLPNVATPVLLLHRSSCASVDIGHARYLRDHLPDADLVLLPGADELWFVGDIEALATAIEGWLDSRAVVG